MTCGYGGQNCSPAFVARSGTPVTQGGLGRLDGLTERLRAFWKRARKCHSHSPERCGSAGFAGAACALVAFPTPPMCSAMPPLPPFLRWSQPCLSASHGGLSLDAAPGVPGLVGSVGVQVRSEECPQVSISGCTHSGRGHMMSSARRGVYTVHLLGEQVFYRQWPPFGVVAARLGRCPAASTQTGDSARALTGRWPRWPRWECAGVIGIDHITGSRHLVRGRLCPLRRS